MSHVAAIGEEEGRGVVRFILDGLDCPNCAHKMERELQRLPGAGDTTINFAARTVDLPERHLDTAQHIIGQIEPDVELIPAESGRDKQSAPPRTALILGAALLLFAAGLLIPLRFPQTIAAPALMLAAYGLAGIPILRRAAFNVWQRRDVFDEHLLMAVATAGALALGELPEAAAVMLFYRVGEYLQDLAVNSSRRSVQALLELRPDFARLQREHDVQTVPPEEVSPGDIIVVHPGDRIPLDGTVTDGTSFVNTAALTGESLPASVSTGDEVLAGTLNEDGVLYIEVTRTQRDSAVERIMRLVEEAAGHRAPTERFITRFARYYTPAVVAAAASLALIPPLLIPGATLGTWGYRALVLLVISCPCALVISIPLGYFAGIGLASRRGILIKGANYLDSLHRVTTVVLDKTGTLTDGEFAVRDIESEQPSQKKQVLFLAAAAEAHSSHPIAAAVAHKWQTLYPGEDPPTPDDYRELAGMGVVAQISGQRVAVGNGRLMRREGVEAADDSTAGTMVHVAADGEVVGRLVLGDVIRPEASRALQHLRNSGIRTQMLTGDERGAARTVAEKLQIDEYRAGLLPEDKVNALTRLRRETSDLDLTLYAGDGINDAPVIAAADVGVAMGGLGSDAAIETADLVIMDDDLQRIPTALRIARLTRRVVMGNIILALGLKACFLVLGSLGLTTMWGAVFADVGVTLLAVLNSTRILAADPTR